MEKIQKNDDVTNEVVDDINISKEFGNLLTDISSLKKKLGEIQHNMRSLEKNIKMKYNQLKNKKHTGTKLPSGIAKPMKISSDLCFFLDKEIGSELARTDVTKALIKYIEQNQLQDQTDKKVINPDIKLKCLLGLDEDSPKITYFTIQKYMNKHFINTKTSKKLFNCE